MRVTSEESQIGPLMVIRYDQVVKWQIHVDVDELLQVRGEFLPLCSPVSLVGLLG